MSELKNKGDIKYYTAEEVSKHDKLDDNWIIIDGKVYDITKWTHKHPGGTMTLIGTAGKDATDIVDLFHGKIVKKYLPNFYIGEFDSQSENQYTVQQKKDLNFLRDYRDLQKQLKKDGMYKIRYSYQVVKTSFVLAFWAMTWAFFIYGYKFESTVLQLLGAIMLAIFYQQTAFMGHDAGHNLISHNRTFDTLYGIIVGNVCTGISMGWWKDSHNCHHVVTNLVQYDPDIQHLPFLSLTNKYFKSLYSFYHQRKLDFDRIGRFLVSHQDLLFYPVMGFARYFLYVQSWLMIGGISPRRPEWPKLEAITLLMSYTWQGYMLSYCLSWKIVFACIFISHFLAGILHIQITLSHFTMDLLEGNEIYKPDQPEESFIEVQIKTTQDISCPTYMDWFHGGLQFQLEHHLFPRVPRHNLGKLRRDYLIPLLKKHNKPVLSMDFISANKFLVKLLKKVANQAREGKFVKENGHLIWDGINMRG